MAAVAARRKEQWLALFAPDAVGSLGPYDDVLFHTEVTGLTWDEARTCRVIGTSRVTG